MSNILSDRRKSIEDSDPIPPEAHKIYQATRIKLLEMFHSASCEARIFRAAGREDMARKYEAQADRAQSELCQLEIDLTRYGAPRSDMAEFARVNNLTHLED